VQGRTGRVMRRHGYRLEPTPRRLRQTAAYFSTTWPLNVAKLWAWRVRERVDDLRGRNPGAATLEESEAPTELPSVQASKE
jgi:hypothetical protein